MHHSALVKATDEMAREKVEGLEAPPPPYPSLKGRRRCVSFLLLPLCPCRCVKPVLVSFLYPDFCWLGPFIARLSLIGFFQLLLFICPVETSGLCFCGVSVISALAHTITHTITHTRAGFTRRRLSWERAEWGSRRCGNWCSGWLGAAHPVSPPAKVRLFSSLPVFFFLSFDPIRSAQRAATLFLLWPRSPIFRGVLARFQWVRTMPFQSS